MMTLSPQEGVSLQNASPRLNLLPARRWGHKADIMVSREISDADGPRPEVLWTKSEPAKIMLFISLTECWLEKEAQGAAV